MVLKTCIKVARWNGSFPRGMSRLWKWGCLEEKQLQGYTKGMDSSLTIWRARANLTKIAHGKTFLAISFFASYVIASSVWDKHSENKPPGLKLLLSICYSLSPRDVRDRDAGIRDGDYDGDCGVRWPEERSPAQIAPGVGQGILESPLPVRLTDVKSRRGDPS